MAARYELWLCNDQGTRVSDRWGNTLLDRVQNFTATHVANDIGRLTMMVPPTFDQAQLRRDMIIQVWRAAEGASLELFRPYFLRGWELETKRGKTSLEISGRCPNDLLRRRVVRAAPGSPHALKGSEKWPVPADDIMRELVSESQDDEGGFGWPAPTYGTRAWPNLSVEGDTSSGPGLGKMDFSYEHLLEPGSRGALPEVGDQAAVEGEEVFFDVVPLILTGKEMTFIFRTRVGQPGQDITHYGVLFSQDRGNLPEAKLSYDYTKEVNMLWNVSESGPWDTEVTQINSHADMDASIWNRCEGLKDANAISGQAALRETRGKVNFVGKIIDTDGMRFGVDWHFGDKVRARYQGFQFDSIVRAVTLQIDRNGKETVSARLEYQASA